MIHHILMPCLHSGFPLSLDRIIKWKKSPGDRVTKGEILLEVELDRANTDIYSFVEGYLAVILAEAGEEVPVDEVIAFIAETEAEIEEAIELSRKYRDR